MLDFETRVSSTKFLERFPLMRGGVIQQNDDRATQMPQQLTQEHTNFLLADVLKKQEIVDPNSTSILPTTILKQSFVDGAQYLLLFLSQGDHTSESKAALGIA